MPYAAKLSPCLYSAKLSPWALWPLLSLATACSTWNCKTSIKAWASQQISVCLHSGLRVLHSCITHWMGPSMSSLVKFKVMLKGLAITGLQRKHEEAWQHMSCTAVIVCVQGIARPEKKQEPFSPKVTCAFEQLASTYELESVLGFVFPKSC